jgi:hypothetical protein
LKDFGQNIKAFEQFEMLEFEIYVVLQCNEITITGSVLLGTRSEESIPSTTFQMLAK